MARGVEFITFYLILGKRQQHFTALEQFIISVDQFTMTKAWFILLRKVLYVGYG